MSIKSLRVTPNEVAIASYITCCASLIPRCTNSSPTREGLDPVGPPVSAERETK